MFLARKIGWAGIAFALLTAGMLLQNLPRSAAGSDSNKKKAPAFVITNEIRKMQEILRDKGYYRGNVDGVFGLRTRDSIRAYQKAEKLPVTGQVDRRTADGLGLRPESSWNNSQSAGRQDGHGNGMASGEIKRNKPSAGIKRADRRASNTSQKKVSRAIAVENGRGYGANKQQASNEERDR
jgi:peptidoglycan hydrolase-like protein with peptidoglycan-binding domain